MSDAQLSLALPPSVSLGAEDFFVSVANADAYALVTRGVWPEGKLVLSGPPASGKSHLARVWAAASGARIVPGTDLAGRSAADRPAPGARIVVEDADRLPAAGEEPLFHLHNQLMSSGGQLLLTARDAPARWPLTLPDLASRMQATSLIRVSDPDTDLLRAVLLKHFADRQLTPTPRVIDYLGARLTRSFAAVADAVERLDVMALSRKSPITLALARAVVGEQEDGGDVAGGPHPP